MGYILTGGISPLSRSKGLAIDQIIEIKGFWGNGKEFHLLRPNTQKESILDNELAIKSDIYFSVS